MDFDARGYGLRQNRISMTAAKQLKPKKIKAYIGLTIAVWAIPRGRAFYPCMDKPLRPIDYFTFRSWRIYMTVPYALASGNRFMIEFPEHLLEILRSGSYAD